MTVQIGGWDINASNSLVAVMGATAMLLIVAACDGAKNPRSPAIGSAGAEAFQALDDWQLSVEKDVITETSATHLVKVLRSEADETLQMEIDLTCDIKSGTVAARMKSDAPYVWQESTGDFVARGFLGAAGIISNPVSTLVQWRVGKVIHEGYIPRGKFNNVAQIDKFFDLKSPDSWSGSLAVSMITERGTSGVETSIDTPHAKAFIKQCKADVDSAIADKIAREAPAKAAAKAAADALHEHVERIRKQEAEYARSEQLGSLWNRWIVEVSKHIGSPLIADGGAPEHLSCSVLINQTSAGEVTNAKTVHCNYGGIDIRVLENGVKIVSPLPAAPESIFMPEFIVDIAND